jgi:hypothetical protein
VGRIGAKRIAEDREQREIHYVVIQLPPTPAVHQGRQVHDVEPARCVGRLVGLHDQHIRQQHPAQRSDVCGIASRDSGHKIHHLGGDQSRILVRADRAMQRVIPLVEQDFTDQRIAQPLHLVEGLVGIGACSATAVAIVAAGAGQQRKPEREAGQDHAAQGPANRWSSS